MVNMVEVVDLMVYFREMMSGYENIWRNPIILREQSYIFFQLKLGYGLIKKLKDT